MGRRPVLEEVDDPFGLRGDLAQEGRDSPATGSRGESVAGEESRQGGSADAGGAPAEEVAAVDVEVVFELRAHESVQYSVFRLGLHRSFHQVGGGFPSHGIGPVAGKAPSIVNDGTQYSSSSEAEIDGMISSCVTKMGAVISDLDPVPGLTLLPVCVSHFASKVSRVTPPGPSLRDLSSNRARCPPRLAGK